MSNHPEKIIHPTREELENYLEALIPELNLRLLIEREQLDETDIWETLLTKERVLLVEQITVTSYETGKEKNRKKGICQAGWQFIKRLMERAGTFLQKKWK